MLICWRNNNELIKVEDAYKFEFRPLLRPDLHHFKNCNIIATVSTCNFFQDLMKGDMDLNKCDLIAYTKKIGDTIFDNDRADIFEELSMPARSTVKKMIPLLIGHAIEHGSTEIIRKTYTDHEGSHE